jgi:hypothetical protein
MRFVSGGDAKIQLFAGSSSKKAVLENRVCLCLLERSLLFLFAARSLMASMPFSSTDIEGSNASATILLKATSPSDIPVQDYTLSVEATSLVGGDITADVTLTASSKAELIPGEITVSPVSQPSIVQQDVITRKH